MINAYNEGYQTGLTWDRYWVPGGPYIYKCNYSGNPKLQEAERQSIQQNASWLQGWRDGREAQMRAKLILEK